MASIAKRPDGRWRARYRDQQGREHARHFARKVDGQRWLDEQTAALVTGTYVDPRAGRTLLRNYAADWERLQVASESRLTMIDNALRLHILPVLGDHGLGALRRSDIQGWVRGLTDHLGPGTIRLIYDVLARMLASAVDDRLLPASPCVRITLPPLPDQEVVPPSVAQVQLLRDSMQAECSAAVVLLAGSGLRIGEVLGLRVADVDFLRRTVRVERQRLQSGKIGPPKTAKSARTVPIGQVVVEALAEHLAGRARSDWMFTDGGKPLVYRRWKTVWGWAMTAGAAEAARRRDATGDEVVWNSGLTTHDLRHFYASALISGGASIKQVQTALGHSTAATTLRVYSHLWPGDEDRTRSIMDVALNGLRTRCGPTAVEAGIAAGQGG